MQRNSTPYSKSSFRMRCILAARGSRDLRKLDNQLANLLTQAAALQRQESWYRSRLEKRRGDQQLDEAAIRKGIENTRTLKLEKHREIQNCTVQLSDKVRLKLNRELESSSFSWHLTLGPSVGRRQTYQIPNDFYTRLVAQEVLANLEEVREGKALDRKSTIRALKTTLERVPDYSILRLDVSKFFASIPHETLEEILSRETNIASTTRELVSLLLKEFSKVSAFEQDASGVPQGVNFSSALAEIYMNDFDSRWSEHPAVAFYCRYVDDIILVVDPDGEDASIVSEMIEKEILNDFSRLGLSINRRKTNRINVCTKDTDESKWKFNYLGYSFQIRKSETPSVVVTLTQERLARIKERIRLSFKSWKRSIRRAQKNNNSQKRLAAIESSNALLIKRLRFLAGNTKVPSSRGSVSVGIYFSNSAITSAEQIETLDSCFKEQRADNNPLIQRFFTKKQKRRLDEISFIKAFELRKFQLLDPKEVQEISKCWKEKVK
ncbi:antiviral reverse transcriptase Drt3a [Corynebacterium tuberculostearicum]|uniref:antiviral reverse transcriptase Drt3a n=1 Tax=Corynebacterium tuberculostearicum TaxID=38304 RepID=UPI00254F4DA0|nr:antiviral reverse transcriptase Drt3a [Corynebacterium tuberculostearicum]MDK8676090.1 antiviral reverse transcriptase Drt3a [Corynebacterium tuberculostearicum]